MQILQLLDLAIALLLTPCPPLSLLVIFDNDGAGCIGVGSRALASQLISIGASLAVLVGHAICVAHREDLIKFLSHLKLVLLCVDVVLHRDLLRVHLRSITLLVSEPWRSVIVILLHLD